MSDKPRGNKTSKAERAERQAKALELMKTGETQEAIADQLGISRTTFWRDLQALEKQYGEGSAEAIAELKKKTLDAIAEQMDAVLAGTLPEGKANAWKGLVAEFSKIAFPRLSYRINENRNGNERLVQGFYAEFARRTIRKFKHQASWQRLWDWIEAQPSDYAEEDRMLLEGHDENIH
jgi:DNA-binding CsgD family transcriptional regulator